MLLNILPLFVLCTAVCDATRYDRYTAKPASAELLSHFASAGLTNTCTMEVAACDETERRRVDGSCNSLNNPVRGTYFEPVYRVLDAVYYNGSLPRKASDDSELEMPRVVRTKLLMEGKAKNLNFTHSVPAYGIFTFGDIGSIHDILQFVRNKTDCCTTEGKKSPKCSNVYVPADDPVHRFSGIRCMNLTTPLIYSDYGCTNDTKPSPIERATAVFDLSLIYNAGGNGDSVIRSKKGGLLTVDVDSDGIIWPPNGSGYCAANQPGETRCFGNYPTALLQGMLLAIWYMRQHNYFAKGLAKVNPSWDDETLFQTARDINIAFAAQVYHYGWAASVIGKDNLVNAGVLSDDEGFRDVYDNSTYPQVSLEFTYILRWFHTMQEGTANMYDTDGTYLKQYPLVNGTFRPGFLGVDNNIVYFTQHMYRQPCAKVDYAVDPDISENGLAYIQQSVDITASDLYKSRLLGFPPYVDYVSYCTGHNITSFDDLYEHIEEERVEQLKEIYANVTDIDLLAGVWAEKLIEGGSIPATLACLIMEFLRKAIRYDRHWYERADRPYAFDEAQLAEIRKASLAQLMCNVGDSVTEIQPDAFRLISTTNQLTRCSDIPTIDLSAWADSISVDTASLNSTSVSGSIATSLSDDNSTSTDSTSASSSSADSTDGDSSSADSTSAGSSSADSTDGDSSSADSTDGDSSSADSTSASSSSAN